MTALLERAAWCRQRLANPDGADPCRAPAAAPLPWHRSTGVPDALDPFRTTCVPEHRGHGGIGAWSGDDGLIHSVYDCDTVQAITCIPNDHQVFVAALQAQVERTAERWNFEDLVDLSPNVDGNVRGKVKDVIKFRNWAAHGRHTTAEPAPSNITPEGAYERLTDFLTAAGIAT